MLLAHLDTDGFSDRGLQMVKRRHVFQNIQNNSLLCLIVGTAVGFLIGRINQYLVAKQNLWCLNVFDKDDIRSRDGGGQRTDEGRPSTIGTTDENLVLIGVMTARKYLKTRVVAVHNTWASKSRLKVIFFTSEGSEDDVPAGIEAVCLKGVDDSYPPQKKSFLMLRYMHDHYVDRFRFFMRADDDVYIKTDELASFLHGIDSANDRALFIGQAGLGNKNEFGMLHLKRDENFCMGGPTMVLSRETLVRLATHVGDCLGNLYTAHEDVELGRCISRHAGVSCTWSYEMQRLFYNNYKEPRGSFARSLKDPVIRGAVTLHPFKNSSYLYLARRHFASREADDVRNKMVDASRRINRMNEVLRDRDDYYVPDKFGAEPTLSKFLPRSGDEVVSWEFLMKHVYSDKHSNPRRNLEPDVLSALDDIVVQLSEKMNERANQKGHLLDFKELLYGYRRVVPPYSADYILDLLLVYRKLKGEQKMSVPVRRHVYVQQTFLHPEARFDPRSDAGPSGSYGRSGDWGLEGSDLDLLTRRINFILPLAGRHETFLQFMKNFEEACLETGEDASLHVVLFQADDSDLTIASLQSASSRYPNVALTFQVLEGQFSRGLALQKGASRFQGDDLLVFIDVDISMSRDVLTRIRLNTVAGEQVYYPTVFSQYNPRFICRVWKEERSFVSGRGRLESGIPLVDTSIKIFNVSNKNIKGALLINNYTDHQKTRPAADANDIGDDSFARDNVSAVGRKVQNILTSMMKNCRGGTVEKTFDLRPEVGYWREFGFGIATMYKKDFEAVGGFDLDIKGWGKEDVDLVEKFIAAGYSVFRSVDPGLAHVYHSIVCNARLDPAQYQMCLGSKASSYASIDTLAEIVLWLPEIFDRGDGSPGSSASTRGGARR